MPRSGSISAFRGGVRGIFGLFHSWWQHKIPLAISLGITACALFLCFYTFVGESPTPILEFVQRLELNALDMRFRYRPRRYARPDPGIVIVDIDQRSSNWDGVYVMTHK